MVPLVNGSIIPFYPAARQENFDSRFCQGTPKAEQKNYLLILPTKAGGAEGIRTPDPHNAIVVLYQLSYDPSRNAHSLDSLWWLSKLFARLPVENIPRPCGSGKCCINFAVKPGSGGTQAAPLKCSFLNFLQTKPSVGRRRAETIRGTAGMT